MDEMLRTIPGRVIAFDRAPAAASDEEAFDELIERWRLAAFDVYQGIRRVQRERTAETSRRLDWLRDAAEAATGISNEVALLCFAAGAFDDCEHFAVPA